MLEIGRILREAREAKNLSLAEVEEATKIRKFYLSALEAEDFQALPGQIYTIGFIKNYARYLDLDPKVMTDAFKSREDSLSAPARTSPRRKRRTAETEEKNQPFIEKHGWKLVLCCMVFVMAVFWMVQSGRLVQDQPTVANPPSETEPDIPENNSAVVQPPIVSENEVKLELVAHGECWILVSSDNQEVYRGTLRNGDKKTYTAKKNIAFTLGNAGVVEVIRGGENLGYLGGEGDVIKKEFILGSE